MSPEIVHLLRKSFEKVEAQGHVAALVFYQRLFEIDPHLRALFHSDIESQARKLIEMLATALAMLEKPEELRITLEQLGARHTGYGVQPQHYATVGAALIDMLATILNREFTPALREAWANLYQYIAATMQTGAASVSENSAVGAG